MEDEASTVRLVRCPKCENLLPELPQYSVYQCGGCGAVLRGKQMTPMSEKRPSEKSDNTKQENISSKSVSQIKRESDDFDFETKRGKTVPGKVSNLSVSSSSKSQKRESLTDSDQSRRRRLDFGKSKVKVFDCNYEHERPKNLPTYDNFGSMEFHRNASVVEKGRFGNLQYSNKGPSSSRLGPYRNQGGLNEPSTVQGLENNRAELLKKLDELKAQLSCSCHVAESPNQSLNGLYNDPPYHPWSHQMPHNPPRHPYPPPSYHPHFRGYNQEPILSQPRDKFFHQPSCSCSQCYDMIWQHSPQKIRSFPSFDSREPLGPPQLPRHHPDRDWTRGSRFSKRLPRRPVMIISRGDERVSHPVSGGAPFISCRNCFELLKIPSKLTFLEKNSHKTVKCGGCSASISLSIKDKKMVASFSSPGLQQNVNDTVSNKSAHSSRDYDKSGYNFQFTSLSVDDQCDDGVIDKSSSDLANLESNDLSDTQNDILAESQRTDQERTAVVAEKSTSPRPNSERNDFSDTQNNILSESQSTDRERAVGDESLSKQKSLKDATEIDVSLTEYLNCDVVNPVEVRREDERVKNVKNESFFGGFIKKRFKDFSRASSGTVKGRSDVFVNGHLLSDRVVKRAEKLAGPIQPGEYWYDHLAGFWGVMNQPCLGIIPPFIEEFDHPMPEKCAAGNTQVFVNSRELNQKDLDLLAGRGLPTKKDKSYIIDISGKVVDEDTGEELEGLGKLAPTVEKVKHGFGMKVPQASSK